MTKNDDSIIEQALTILESRVRKTKYSFTKPSDVSNYLTLKLGNLEHEVFAVMFLDNRNRLIEYNEMFRGTIDGASVYPREVAKHALAVNAATVIFGHNHPSGVAQPSTADQRITEALKLALGLFDIRVLDHFIIGGRDAYSFAEYGLI